MSRSCRWSARTASSASSIPTGLSVSRKATSCERSSSRSPPTADSSAISQSAVIATTSRYLASLEHGAAGVVDDEPGSGTVGRLEGTQVRAHARLRLRCEDRAQPHRRPARGMRRPSRCARDRRTASPCQDRGSCRIDAPTPAASSRRSDRPMTGSGRRSRSGRIHAGAGHGRADPAGWWHGPRRRNGNRPRRRAAAGRRSSRCRASTRVPTCSPSREQRFGDRVELVEASATSIPFPDASFDHLTFTYLLRYVDDPAATLTELARVVRPGGSIASLEFCVPRGAWRPLWDLYVGVGLPLAGRRDLARVVRGRTVPRPVDPIVLRALASRAAAPDVGGGGNRTRPRAPDEPRWRRRHLGPARWNSREVRPAFYALRGGGWRDWITLLHLPYTAWHLSYVVVGGCLVAHVSWDRLGLTVVAFFLAMGIGAHALDELQGRPLQTSIPSSSLVALPSSRSSPPARSGSRSQ